MHLAGSNRNRPCAERGGHPTPHRGGTPPFLRRDRRQQRGSAILVVLVFLVVITSIVVSNSMVLRHLKREIRLIEQHHRKRLESSVILAPPKARPIPATNQIEQPILPSTPP